VFCVFVCTETFKTASESGKEATFALDEV